VSQPGELTVEDLARDHLEMLYRYAYRLTHSSADAEDLVHETFVVAAEKIDQVRSRESARAWLIQILRSRLSRHRRRQLPRSSVGVEEIQAAEPAESALGIFEESFSAEQAMKLLREMPAEFRDPLLLFYFEEMRYREIAEALGIPLGTVMSRIARGKAYLRDKLAPLASTLGEKDAR
jgi:RNA polymerase sigma-70 factor (ECF subfamily)